MANDLEIEIGANTRNLSNGLKAAEGKLKGFASSPAIGGIATALSGAFSIAAISQFTQQVFNATAEFQKFGAVLGNTLGSATLANMKLKEIADFAAKTPFGINELTGAFVKLANSGFRPTASEMTKLGDLASSTGKSFDQLAEAILDAQSGEFERLKEFGIRAKDAGDSVIFTYKGVQTQTEKTASSIREYITSLGAAEGVSGSMAVISETLGGKISNLRDNWDQLLVSVGNNTEGVFSGAISILSDAVKKITEFNVQSGIASKFGLKQDFGFGFVNGKFLNQDWIGDVKKVEDAQKSVSKYVKSIQEIAKTPEEFKSAIKSLGDLAKSQIQGIKNASLAKAIAAQYVEGINQLRDIATKGAAPVDNANFGKKDGKDPAEKVRELKKELKELKQGNYISGLEQIQRILNDTDKRTKEIGFNDKSATFKPTSGTPPVVDVVLGGSSPEGVGEMLYTPFEILKDEIDFDLLPKIGDNFKTFFDDILMDGELSFKSLGEAIKNTFASVLASEAANGIISLLQSDEAKAKNGERKTGLFGAIGGLFGSKNGESSGNGKGLGNILGAALPFAGIAIGAASLLGGLFKKKPKDIPASPTLPSTSNFQTGGAVNNFNGGRVVFEIAGQKLVGVLTNTLGANSRFIGP